MHDLIHRHSESVTRVLGLYTDSIHTCIRVYAHTVQLSLKEQCRDLERQLSEECGRREGVEKGRERLEGEVEGLRGENSTLASQLREKTQQTEQLDKEARLLL